MAGFAEYFRSADPKRYVDNGFELTHTLIQRFRLPDWDRGRPETTETDRIYLDMVMHQFTESSKAEARQNGGETISYHPELWPFIERSIADCALRLEAWENFSLSPWRTQVSIYLKAWASGLNPCALLPICFYLASEGEKKMARHVLEVCSAFPRYWDSLPDSESRSLLFSYATINAYVPHYAQSGLIDVAHPSFASVLLQDIAKTRSKTC